MVPLVEEKPKEQPELLCWIGILSYEPCSGPTIMCVDHLASSNLVASAA